jgi:hypothetical protein
MAVLDESVRQRIVAGGALTASPAVAGGALVIGSQEGTLYCLR